MIADIYFNLNLPQDQKLFTRIASDYQQYDPLTTCAGFVGSRISVSKSDLKIDSYSLEKMNEDTAFAKFKIVKW